MATMIELEQQTARVEDRSELYFLSSSASCGGLWSEALMRRGDGLVVSQDVCSFAYSPLLTCLLVFVGCDEDTTENSKLILKQVHSYSSHTGVTVHKRYDSHSSFSPF